MELPSKEEWENRGVAFAKVIRLSESLLQDVMNDEEGAIPDVLKNVTNELGVALAHTIEKNGMTPSEAKMFVQEGSTDPMYNYTTVGAKVYAKAKEEPEAYLAFVTMRLREAVAATEIVKSSLKELCTALQEAKTEIPESVQSIVYAYGDED